MSYKLMDVINPLKAVKLYLFGLAALAYSLAADLSLRAGSPAPVGMHKADVRSFLVFLPKPASLAACTEELAALRGLRDSLNKFGITVVAIIQAPQAACPANEADAPAVIYDTDGRLAGSYKTDGKQLGVLVDELGLIRRIIRAPDGFIGKATNEVKAWDEGKATYDAMCARCHGADGKNTNYPEIKKLDGIGNRYSEAEILRRTYLTGAVDLSGLNDARQAALANYIASL